MRAFLVAVTVLLMGSAAAAQQGRVLPAGTAVSLITGEPLSSKTSAKGDLVPLVVASDVLVGDCLVIAKGAAAVGQVADARAKGALGMNGKLEIRALYLKAADTFVRLDGSARNKGTVTAGAVIGLALIMPGFTGRSSQIPSGSPLTGHVLRDVALPGSSCSGR